MNGIRRSDNSTIMEIIKDKLVDSGVSKENVFYYNLDKYGFKNIKAPYAQKSLPFENEYPDGVKYVLVEMCFVPNSPMSERLKEALYKLMEEQQDESN